MAAKVEVGGRDAKGLEDVGDACDDREKGFALLHLDVGMVAPKSVAPRSVGCLCGSGLGNVCSPFDNVTLSGSCLITSLIARILPNFRLHCFFLHVKTCSLLSSFGKYSGRSPLSCRRSDIALLHTLHLANEAGGVLEGSSHVYLCCQRPFLGEDNCA